MTGINSSENNDLLNAHWSNLEFDSEPHILTQEAVVEEIKNYITPLTEQLEDLTRLVHGMSRGHQVNLPPTVSTCANSSTTGASSDNRPDDSLLN